MSYVIGLDVGGTFTDCVVLDERGEVVADKAFTTPANTALGMVQAIENTSRALGKPIEAVLLETRTLALGTTTITNLLINRKGDKVGLLTTKGHEDATLIGRAMAKTEGLPEREKLDILAWDKPRPLVPRVLIRGVAERIDYKGAVIAPLQVEEVEAAVAELVGAGAQAIAVCFLWSFANSVHQRKAKEIISRKFPLLFVYLSSEVAPVLGEYERAMTTIMNAHLGRVAAQEVHAMRDVFAGRGFKRPILVMQSSGGVIWDEEVPRRPLNIVASGPAGGVNEAAQIGRILGQEQVIATDMGGTSFDVGLVVTGRPRLAHSGTYERFRVYVPTVEVVSVGAGGGSIAWIDPITHGLKVGPHSAGSDPGPVCYGRGGEEPTVTDADVVLNRIAPESFFGGRQRLDRDRALKAVEKRIAAAIGCDAVQAAKGIVDIVDARMADLIRKLTVERGLDPRDFVLMAYGGAGPTHVGAYGREIGLRQALVSPFAPVFSALGVASSDIVRHYARSEPMQQPFQTDRVKRVFEDLERRAIEDLPHGQTEGEPVTLTRFVDMRFRYQVHEIRVPVTWELSSSEAVERLTEAFIAVYEQTFGPGAALRAAGVETLTFHVVSVVPATSAALKRFPNAGADPGNALQGTRSVYWDDGFVDTPVFDARRLATGNRIPGPAVIEASNTTILIHPGQRASVDEYLNINLEF
jgi:N-methylhydantoinase A